MIIKSTTRKPQINAEVEQSFYDEFNQWIEANGYMKGRYVQLALWIIQRMNPSTLSLCVNAMNSNKTLTGKRFVITLEDYLSDETEVAYQKIQETIRNAVKKSGRKSQSQGQTKHRKAE
jgi:hypothetical protein